MESIFLAQLPGAVIGSAVGIVDLIFIALFHLFSPGILLLPKLLFLIGVSALTLFLSLVFLPKKLKGQTPKWIADKYSNYIPSFVRVWIMRNF